MSVLLVRVLLKRAEVSLPDHWQVGFAVMSIISEVSFCRMKKAQDHLGSWASVGFNHQNYIYVKCFLIPDRPACALLLSRIGDSIGKTPSLVSIGVPTDADFVECCS